MYWLLPDSLSRLIATLVGTQPSDFQSVIYWLLPDSLSRLTITLIGAQPLDFQPVMYWLLPDFLSQFIAASLVPNLLISSQSCIGCCLTPQLGLCSLLLVPNPLSPAY